VILDLCSASSRYGTRWIVGGGFPVTDRPWKAEERHVARLLGGQRHWANSGRPVDVESAGFVCQVKHRRVCSLAELERLAVELEQLGGEQGNAGLAVVKRRAGQGRRTPRLVVMTERVWRGLYLRPEQRRVRPLVTAYARGRLSLRGKERIWIAY
jgi:hypothetical protein